jgi:hypothetical protein
MLRVRLLGEVAAERDGEQLSLQPPVKLDPLNEAAHTDLVRQLAAAGDRAGAPIVGLVEPGWELRRLTAELAGLDELTEVS